MRGGVGVREAQNGRYIYIYIKYILYKYILFIYIINE